MTRPKGQVQVDFLRRVLADKGRIVEASFSLQRELLKDIQPTYFLTLEQNGGRSLQELPWTPQLEQFLLADLHQQLTPEEDEAERFAAIVLNNLASAEQQHGKDYAQAVFIEILRERHEFGPELQTLIDRVPVNRPSHDSRAYASCRQFLMQSLDGLRNEAQLGLGYDSATTLRLLGAALRIVVDEAFHVSASEYLFPRRS